MKRLLVILGVIACCAGLVSCGGSDGSSDDTDDTGDDDGSSLDEVVELWEREAEDQGLDEQTTACVTQYLEATLPESGITDQQANNALEEGVLTCATGPTVEIPIGND